MKNLIPVAALTVLAACHAGPDTSNADAVPPLQDSAVVADVISPDSLVEPGKSAGPFVLGADAGPQMNRLGKPDSGDAAMGKAMAIWKINGHQTSLLPKGTWG